MIIYVIFIGFALLSWIVQSVLKSKFNKYSKISLPSGLSGREVAERMLQEHGIYDVKVSHVRGQLTDHYNPLTKTINLSEGVYNSKSIAAASVAAHECGHAVQHATAYTFLTMRSKLVPVVSFTSGWMHWVLLAGILLMQSFPYLLLFGIVLFGLTTLFSFVTLPVEINASARAVAWLNKTGITNVSTQPMAVDALKWAAYTYVIAALSSLATLIYYILIFLGGRNRN
ncbi:MAG: zinc metallopeptidase [Bacteroidales bacterium]|nr:zinc metallopeptidase [Bacteroidales bacterium]MDD4362467.1 zinc metallopeptidase [Bacteroidales bacterium]MDD4430549.1 zinc metallopeptidase [Bacteroidales bacterium]